MSGDSPVRPDQDPAPADDASHGRHTAVGTLQGLAASLITIPTGLATAAYLTRALGPDGYGVLAVTLAVLSWVQVAVIFGIDRTAVRLVAESPDWRLPAARLVRTQLGVALVGGVLMFLLADVGAAVVRTPQLSTTLRLAAIDVPIFALVAIHGSMLIGQGKFGRSATLATAYWVIRLSLVVTFVEVARSVDAAVLAVVATSAATFVVARFLVRPPFFKRVDYPWEKIWSYAWPLFFFTIAVNLFGSLDLFFVKAMDPDTAAAGFFGAAKNLTILPATFAGALASPLLTKLTELTVGDNREPAQAIARRSVRLVLCMLPFAAMTAGAATEIVTLVYGDEFAPAGPLLGALMVAGVGGSVMTLAASMLIAAGRPGATVALTAPLAVLAFAVYWLVLPLYGSLGAALASAALGWAGALVGVWLANVYWSILPLGATFVRCLVCSVPAWAIAAMWPTPGWLVVAKIVVTSGVIVALLFATRELGRAEIDFVRGLLPAGRADDAEGR